MSSISLSSRGTERIAAGRLPGAVGLAIVVAVIANLIVFYLAGALGVNFSGPFMGPDAPPSQLSLVEIIGATVVPAIAGGVFLWILNRFTAQPIRFFIIAAIIFGVLSLGGPLMLPVDGSVKVSLLLMHIITGTLIVGMLIRQTRQTDE